MKPLLAHTYEPHRVAYPCYVQPKLNGIRALCQNGGFQSRDELPFSRSLLSHLSEPLQSVFDPSVILDGELYVHGWPLQRINAAVTPVRQQPTEDTLKVEFHVFDVVDFERSFVERINIQTQIGHLRKAGGQIALVHTVHVGTEQLANLYYAQFVEDKFEGMIYRIGSCPYTVPHQSWWQRQPPLGRARFWSDQSNRCWHLLKRKDWQDDEFPFVSINETVGDKGESGFQLWATARNGAQFKFGSGLTDAEVQHYLENPPVGRKIKGKYLVLSSEGIPLNATIEAIL